MSYIQVASPLRHQLRIQFLLTFGKLSIRQHMFVDELTTLTAMMVSPASVSSPPCKLPLCFARSALTHLILYWMRSCQKAIRVYDFLHGLWLPEVLPILHEFLIHLIYPVYIIFSSPAPPTLACQPPMPQRRSSLPLHPQRPGTP